MSYYFQITEDGREVSDWIEAFDVSVEYEQGYDTFGTGTYTAGPQTWGRLAMVFEYSVQSDLTRFNDTRYRDITISTFPNGESFNTFQRTFLSTFQYGEPFLDDRITAEATWIFGNVTTTLADLNAIFDKLTPPKADNISWQKYGF